MNLPELSPGLLIDGGVRLVRLLGEGGMGSVWVADHLRLGTQVAVKFLSASLAKEAEPIVRFQHEAMSAAQIKSPHVVQTFDHGVFAGEQPYIVMELLEGEDLGRRLERAGPLSLGDLSRVVVQTCRALGKAHAAGIVHRDIKPDNIFLLDQDGEIFVKVLDFGVAKRTQAVTSMALTHTGAMVGTPYYMSPEQMLDLKHLDFRADLWSLGVVAYRCLLGRVPFEGRTLGALCVAIEKGTFELPSRERDDVPPALDAWFAKALGRDPATRFGSARQMAEAFLAATAPAYVPGVMAPPSSGDRWSSPDGVLDAWRAVTPIRTSAPSWPDQPRPENTPPSLKGQAWPDAMQLRSPSSSGQVRPNTLAFTPPTQGRARLDATMPLPLMAPSSQRQSQPDAASPTSSSSQRPSQPDAASQNPPLSKAQGRLDRASVTPSAMVALILPDGPPPSSTPRSRDAKEPERGPSLDSVSMNAPSLRPGASFSEPPPRHSRRKAARWVAFSIGALVSATGLAALISVSREALERPAAGASGVSVAQPGTAVPHAGRPPVAGTPAPSASSVAPPQASAPSAPQAAEVPAHRGPGRGRTRGEPETRRPGRPSRAVTAKPAPTVVYRAPSTLGTPPADGASPPPAADAPRPSGPLAPPAPAEASPPPAAPEGKAAPDPGGAPAAAPPMAAPAAAPPAAAPPAAEPPAPPRAASPAAEPPAPAPAAPGE